MSTNRREMGLPWMARAVLVATTILTAPGCRAEISPQPEPPAKPDIFGVDLGQVQGEVGSFSNGFMGLRGASGAAKPPGARLRTVNLEGIDDPVDTTIGADGSFEAFFPVNLGDEVRVQIFTDDDRSSPFDVVVTSDLSSPTPAVRALGDCLKLTPALELVLDQGAGAVRIDNECAEPVVLAAPSLRRPVSGLTAGSAGTWPATLPPGGSLSVHVQDSSSATEPLSEVIFLEVTSPVHDRRPITVWSDP